MLGHFFARNINFNPRMAFFKGSDNLLQMRLLCLNIRNMLCKPDRNLSGTICGRRALRRLCAVCSSFCISASCHCKQHSGRTSQCHHFSPILFHHNCTLLILVHEYHLTSHIECQYVCTFSHSLPSDCKYPMLFHR